MPRRTFATSAIIGLIALGLSTGHAEARVGDIAYGITIGGGGARVAPPSIFPRLAHSNAEFVRIANGYLPSKRMRPSLDKLQAQGIQIGTKVGRAGWTPTQTVLDRAAKLRPFYDWIFLDQAHGPQNLQALVNGLNAQGWKVGSNDNDGPIARGQWAHMHLISILRKQPERIAHLVHHNPKRLVAGRDRRWIHRVHTRDPGSLAVLKPEIYTQVDRLSHMHPGLQRQLFSKLAHLEKHFHFRFLRPVFVPHANGTVAHSAGVGYSSIAERTFSTLSHQMR